MANKIRVGLTGAAGYTGGELIRLLIHHPGVEISFLQSSSNAGMPVALVHQDLAGDTELSFSKEITKDIDVLFICSGHGKAIEFLEKNDLPSHTRVIDIGNDFRLHAGSVFKNRSFVYGLPELNREKIRLATNIANPGCFATAINLGLLPLAKQGLLSAVYTTGITGSTGAGQTLAATSHFSWRANNIQAYKTLTHQHLGEIKETLLQGQGQGYIDISFIPWRGDFTRGIFVSSQLDCDLGFKEVSDLYQAYYRTHPFVTVCDEISLKQVVNTNKAVIQLEQQGNRLVIHSAIDNLLKGASGQAIQNMNLMFGLEEATGLQLKANYY